MQSCARTFSQSIQALDAGLSVQIDLDASTQIMCSWCYRDIVFRSIGAQAQALLESPSPLADVYRYFEKLGTGYMDVIRDSIENRADDVCRAKEELRTTAVYPHSAAYASEHGEMAQYNLSYQANSACKEAIEQTTSAHYAENRLDTEAAVKDVLEKFLPSLGVSYFEFQSGSLNGESK